MAETKNVFLGAKMNKDLDPRLVSNREYIEARNASAENRSSSGSNASFSNQYSDAQYSSHRK